MARKIIAEDGQAAKAFHDGEWKVLVGDPPKLTCWGSSYVSTATSLTVVVSGFVAPYTAFNRTWTLAPIGAPFPVVNGFSEQFGDIRCAIGCYYNGHATPPSYWRLFFSGPEGQSLWWVRDRYLLNPPRGVWYWPGPYSSGSYADVVVTITNVS